MLEKGEPTMIMDVVTDPVELAKARRQREQFQRNADWLDAHAQQVFPRHRGKCICVTSEELFVADSPEAAYKLARDAHPEDEGPLVRYIPLKHIPRIYANFWGVAPLR